MMRAVGRNDEGGEEGREKEYGTYQIDCRTEDSRVQKVHPLLDSSLLGVKSERWMKLVCLDC